MKLYNRDSATAERPDNYLFLCRIQHLYHLQDVKDFKLTDVVKPPSSAGLDIHSDYKWGRVPIVWMPHLKSRRYD